ncbi:FAD-dependent monooxygenase [Streptomyces sp. URMC 126]|uniref:FAD-dependent monooxygenase n=1 Tax=Streptomyces sp. URMC 126 TaxID=3423401 RepID=UPI003F19FCCE
MTARLDTEVLVVGAGPTGLLLGAELALAGVRTCVVERRATRQRDSRALNLHPRSLELMDQRGLADRFLALGRTVPGWQLAATVRTPLDFSALTTRHPYALLLAQSRTEALLEERAKELGAVIRRGHTVTALRQDADGVEADLVGPQGPTLVRARFAAGCDGAHSIVRSAAGIAFPGTPESFTAMVGDFAVADHAHIDRARRNGVLIARLEPGLTRFVVMDPERMRVPSGEPVTLEEFRAALTRVCGTDCGIARPGWLSRFGNATRLAEHYRHRRLFLAGDAAHIHFPVGAQGLNTGLQDAMNLGWKLAAELRGWAAPGLLDTYHAERHPVGRAVTDRTLAQTLLVELPLTDRYRRGATVLCELLDTLLGLPEVNRRLAGELSALDTAYPPTDPTAHPCVGRPVPDTPLVMTRDGRRTRIHRLLHEGRFVLLHLTEHGPTDLSAFALRHQAISVTAATTEGDDPTVKDLTEILIRPDGHIAWATHTTSPDRLHSERTQALRTWIRT